jgi:PPK2 family polyphosphate:nucleotide phosphotransferase
MRGVAPQTNRSTARVRTTKAPGPSASKAKGAAASSRSVTSVQATKPARGARKSKETSKSAKKAPSSTKTGRAGSTGPIVGAAATVESKQEKLAKPSREDRANENLLKNIDLSVWRVEGRPSLREADANSTPGNSSDQKTTEAASKILRERLMKLQDCLISDGSHSVLLILQAMDAGGKDGTVKSIYAGLNPSAAAVHGFSVPSEEELAHDFLWRIHARTPAKGSLTIFNRSHYEDVLAVRVRKIAPPTVWRPRFEQIRNFEAILAANRTTIVKVMLHISNEEQQKRLQARIDRPEKRWKFRMGDLEDRALWPEYKRAYQDAIVETNTKVAPWYVVPADRKWYRDYAVLSILVATLEGLHLKYPEFSNLDGLKIP